MGALLVPTVSVILCTYQQAKYLQCAIDSVLNQTYRDLELIIIDNGSTDGSDEIIMAAAECDDRIDYTLYRDNDKVTKRLNAAIQQAKGEWISILYGDDYYLPNKLQAQLDYAAQVWGHIQATVAHPFKPRIIYSPGYGLDVHTDTITLAPTCRQSGDILVHLLHHAIEEGFINPISPLVRRECYDGECDDYMVIPRGEAFDETVVMEGETWYWRAAHRWEFYFLDVPCVVMRSHGSNEGLKVGRNFELALRLHDKLIPRLLWPWEQKAALAYYDQLRVHFAWCAIRMTQDRELAQTILRPLRRFPRSRRELAARLCSMSSLAMHAVNACLC